jgi:RHS repeat-associated protein
MTLDQNGNLATETDGSGTTSYTWNARNQLTALSGPGLSATFGYDGLGRRRTKTISGARTDFLYDGLNPVQEGVLPATPAANLLTGLGIDEYFSRTDAASTRHFLPDALGSTLALTDALGALITEHTYEPFGGTTTGGPTANSFQYTGRENDGTELYYYRARYYHPSHHRFLSEDPLEFFTDDTNLYVYVLNAPTMYTDPFGLWRFPFIPRTPPPPPGYPRPPGWTPEWPWRYPEWPDKTPKNPTPRWFDPKNGEWRWHPPDPWHPKGHWDHNPWTEWNSPWRNVPPGGAVPPMGGRKDPWEPCYQARACI